MDYHPKYKTNKKYFKKNSKSTSKTTSHKPHYKPKHHHESKSKPKHHHESKIQCECKQLFYAPLPNLSSKPPTQTVTPGEWFAPGSVQSCCSICSSIKPVYETTSNGYCCKKY